MKLTILERIQLQNLLPKEGDVVSLIQIKGLKEKINVTDEEASNCELKISDNGMLTYNLKKEIVKEVKPTVEQVVIVKGVFSGLNETKKMHIDLLGLYEKFDKL